MEASAHTWHRSEWTDKDISVGLAVAWGIWLLSILTASQELQQAAGYKVS